MENRQIKLLISYGSSSENYVKAFNALGALTVAKYLPEIDTNYDGLILAGGGDIHPSRFNEEIDGSDKIDLDRDRVEFELLKAYVDLGKPVLGICRGHQLINVFFGGSLYQDLPEAELHKRQNGCDSVHVITADPESVLGKIYGESFSVNSSHHQAVKRLGEGLKATACWNSLYVEAVEHTSLPIIGVQWHPERMCFERKRDDTVSGSEILSYFIDLCKKHREK